MLRLLYNSPESAHLVWQAVLRRVGPVNSYLGHRAVAAHFTKEASTDIMAGYDFGLFTIGAGSGGVSGSRRAASYGARVGICEDSRVGGTCVIRGCVPEKLLAYGAHFAEDFVDATSYRWTLGETRLH